jgi:hypothetical protein
MSTVQAQISDMLVTVKSREIQRGMLAEMAGERARAARHLLAAAYLELVLADDYAQAGEDEMAFRSRVSAASCLWRAGEVEQARTQFDALLQDHPSRAATIQQGITELERVHPNPAA